MLTLDEEGKAITDYKNPKQDANQEWVMSSVTETAATSDPPTGGDISANDVLVCHRILKFVLFQEHSPSRTRRVEMFSN